MTEKKYREALSRHGKQSLIELLVEHWKSTNKIIENMSNNK